MPPSVPDSHDGPSGTRTPVEALDIGRMRTWEIYHIDLRRAWDLAKKGFRGVPKNMRLSDEAAFALSVFMPPSMRAKYFPYDFDSRGDLRECRVAQDPPMIIQCHGINWFPTYRGSNILCGSWWGAVGWLRSLEVSPDYGYKIGEFVAPPEAAKLCTTPLQLDGHQLCPSPSGISPDKLVLEFVPPVSLEDAIARQGIALDMDVASHQVLVIKAKEKYALQFLPEIEGFHYLAGPHSDPRDPAQSIIRHPATKDEDLKEKYGGPYKNSGESEEL